MPVIGHNGDVAGTVSLFDLVLAAEIDGRLSEPVQRIMVSPLVEVGEEKKEGKAAIYARVSSADQKADLDRQVARLLEFANSKGLAVAKAVTEIGSGLNGHRKKLMQLLANPEITTIIVEHRDRLVRFGFEYIEAALMAQGRKILVMEPGEVKDDLVQDMVEVLTSFCARLYGRRSAKNRVKRAMEAIQNAGK